MAERYFNEAGDDYARIFALAHNPKNRGKIEKRFLPRFSQIAFLVQMPHMDVNDEVVKMKGDSLTELDKQEISRRSQCAEYWLKTYAPEKYRFELRENVPEAAKQFDDKQKQALKILLDYIKSRKTLEGQELHSKLHRIKEQTKIEPADFFKAIYISFLNRESGPQAGWFLSVLDKDFLEKRLEEVLK
jgi:lysyl-tRNA synthetase class 1